MKVLLSFIFLLPYISVFGQLGSSIDCVTGLNVGYRYLNPNKTDVFPGYVDIRNAERIGIRADFGVNYNLKVGSKLYLKTGVRFADKGYNSRKIDDLKWGLEGHNGVYDPNAVQNNSELKSIVFKYHFFFVEVPIALRYEFYKKGKFSLYGEAGGSAAYYIQSVTVQKTNLDKKKINKKEDPINDFHLAAIIGAGVNYQVNGKTQLFLQPNFNYQLTDLVNAPDNVHLYTAGLEIGCRHGLN